jgi:hypothetical protein
MMLVAPFVPRAHAASRWSAILRDDAAPRLVP